MAADAQVLGDSCRDRLLRTVSFVRRLGDCIKSWLVCAEQRLRAEQRVRVTAMYMTAPEQFSHGR
ncbi:MAG TPA: hypothetical protein DEF45_02300 [Rhodopirellula sp.]|nr:hypothetical protein [Rhodopirellula sp.]